MKRLTKWFGLSLAVASLAVVTTTSRAGTQTFDFETNPTNQGIAFFGNAQWRQSSGNPGGYLSITDAVNSQQARLVFPDIDDGLPIRAFTFEADLRVGGGTDTPADGFSINYARADDPVVLNPEGGAFAASPTGEGSLPEEGTQTGLAIGLDEWLSGGTDVRGFSIRVDNVILQEISLPTVNGSLTDTTSLQTGTQNPDRDPNDITTSWANLGWARFKMELNEQGQITLEWKGQKFLDKFQTTFFPSPGRIIFAGRTGGANGNHHVDNITLTTTPATSFFITGMSGRADGVRLQVTDIPGRSELVPSSVQIILNGTPAPAADVTVSKQGAFSTITYNLAPAFLPAGSTNTVTVEAQDNNGVTASDSREFVVRPYIVLDPAWIAPAGTYDTANPGFAGMINQIAVARGPGDANSTWNAFRHLAGGFIDPATGQPYANLVDPTAGVDANGNFAIPDTTGNYPFPWINMNQDFYAATQPQAGSFQSPEFPDDPIPGIVPESETVFYSDNIVMEAYTYLQLEGSKQYVFAVNSDDGFHVAFGPQTRSAIFTAGGGASTSTYASQYNGGKGSSDVSFDVIVPEGAGGVYRARLVWWEGGGGANLEFIQILDDGTKVLVGAESASNYKPAGAVQVPADVVSVAPWPGQTGIAPDSQVQIIIADGAGQVVNANSITVALNGEEPPKTATKVGDKTRVTVTPDGLLDPNTVYTVEINYTAGGTEKSASYQFTVINYPTLPPFLATDIGTGSEPGMRWRTHQIIVGHGTIISGAESTLAGDLGPSVHDPNGHTTPQGADGFFRIDWVNFTQVPGTENEGNFRGNQTNPLLAVPDEGIPGIPGTTASTDNIAAEALTFIELQPGFYRMVVNSDDGFEVTTGTADPANRKFLSLGRFDGGRGATDTVFFFNVEQAGVYFFRLLWFEGGGGANVEWFTVDANGVRSLIGGEQAGSLDAFRVRTVAEPTIPSEATFNPPTISGGQVTLSWTGSGTLQESTNLIDWSNSASQTNPQTVTPDGVVKAYRILVSP